MVVKESFPMVVKESFPPAFLIHYIIFTRKWPWLGGALFNFNYKSVLNL